MAARTTTTTMPASTNNGKHVNGTNNNDINYNNAFVVLNKTKPVTNTKKRKILLDFMLLDSFEIVVLYNNLSI